MDNNLIVSNGAIDPEVIEVKNTKLQLFSVESLDLEGIEVVDLKKGLSQIAAKIAEDKNATILAVEACNKAEILSAIAAGASGALSENIILEDAHLAIQALKQGLILVDNRRSNVCNFAIVPQALINTKIEQLRRELATTLVRCWRKKSLPEDLNLESVEKKVVSSDFVTAISQGIECFSFEKELKTLSKGEKNYHLATKANLNSLATKYQESYFSQKLYRSIQIPNSALMKIRTNAYQQKEQLASLIADFFLRCTKFGSMTVKQFFLSTILKLKKYEIHWESQHQSAKEKTMQYYSSYCNLAIKFSEKENQKDFESALRVLELFYDQTLRAEVYRSVSCLIFELIQELNFYYERANKCDLFLQEIEELSGLEEIETVKVDAALQSRFFLLRNELESRFGSIFDWCDRETARLERDRSSLKDTIAKKIGEECRIWALELILEKY